MRDSQRSLKQISRACLEHRHRHRHSSRHRGDYGPQFFGQESTINFNFEAHSNKKLERRHNYCALLSSLEQIPRVFCTITASRRLRISIY